MTVRRPSRWQPRANCDHASLRGNEPVSNDGVNLRSILQSHVTFDLSACIVDDNARPYRYEKEDDERRRRRRYGQDSGQCDSR